MIKPLKRIVNEAYKVTDFTKAHLRALLVAGVTFAYSFGIGCAPTFPRGNIYPYSGPPNKITSDYATSIDTEANRLLFEFPENIPGARKVEKFYSRNAVKLVVHLREMHLTDKYADKIWDFLYSEARKEVERVQQDCYTILSFLCDKGLLSAVYTEGDTKDDIDREKYGLERFTNLVHSDEEQLKKDPKNRKLKEKLYKHKQWLEEQKKSMEEIARYDAVARLYFQRKIEVRDADSPISGLFFEHVASSSFRKGDVASLKDESDWREDTVLLYMFQSDDALGLTVFGGGHDWLGRRFFSPRNNLKDWMEKNPDKPISFIEITPKNYR